MRIVGIDCGTERTGFGVIDTDGRCHRLVSAGVIRTKAADALEQRLRFIAAELRAVIGTFAPETVAVEAVFHAVNARSALKLAHVRGVALLLAAEAGLSVSELNAEITVDTAMVKANCRKNWPMMPVMKAHGMYSWANPWFRWSLLSLVGLTVGSVLVGFVWLPSVQADFTAVL